MRPDVQLFLHVAGATALFGATATVAIIGLTARQHAEQLRLARAAFATTLVVGIPSWVMTLVFGSWAKSKEDLPDSLDWLRIGSGVVDAGILFLLAAAGISYAWIRRPENGRLPLAAGILAVLYVAALAVAWWVMTAKT